MADEREIDPDKGATQSDKAEAQKLFDKGSTTDVRELRDEDGADAPAGAKSPMEDAGAPGGTSGTGGTSHEQDN
jgi:hypothetical protein